MMCSRYKDSNKNWVDGGEKNINSQPGTVVTNYPKTTNFGDIIQMVKIMMR
jgi:hypothetical protein